MLRPEISESELKNEVVGLNLLFLIVENRMADFHSEVTADPCHRCPDSPSYISPPA